MADKHTSWRGYCEIIGPIDYYIYLLGKHHKKQYTLNPDLTHIQIDSVLKNDDGLWGKVESKSTLPFNVDGLTSFWIRLDDGNVNFKCSARSFVWQYKDQYGEFCDYDPNIQGLLLFQSKLQVSINNSKYEIDTGLKYQKNLETHTIREIRFVPTDWSRFYLTHDARDVIDKAIEIFGLEPGHCDAKYDRLYTETNLNSMTERVGGELCVRPGKGTIAIGLSTSCGLVGGNSQNLAVAYHGTRAKDIRSIVENGLLVKGGGKTTKAHTAAAFGEGVYLTPDLLLACNPSYGERIKIDGQEYIVVLDVRVRQEDFEKKGDLFDSGEVWLASESLECKITNILLVPTPISFNASISTIRKHIRQEMNKLKELQKLRLKNLRDENIRLKQRIQEIEKHYLCPNWSKIKNKLQHEKKDIASKASTEDECVRLCEEKIDQLAGFFVPKQPGTIKEELEPDFRRAFRDIQKERKCMLLDVESAVYSKLHHQMESIVKPNGFSVSSVDDFTKAFPDIVESAVCMQKLHYTRFNILISEDMKKHLVKTLTNKLQPLFLQEIERQIEREMKLKTSEYWMQSLDRMEMKTGEEIKMCKYIMKHIIAPLNDKGTSGASKLYCSRALEKRVLNHDCGMDLLKDLGYQLSGRYLEMKKRYYPVIQAFSVTLQSRIKNLEELYHIQSLDAKTQYQSEDACKKVAEELDTTDQAMPRVKSDLDIGAAKMHEWLSAVAEWEDYDWSNIVTEFEARLQAFVPRYHVYEMDNRKCYLKVFSRWGWCNWKFSRPLKQNTFKRMASDVKDLMQTIDSQNIRSCASMNQGGYEQYSLAAKEIDRSKPKAEYNVGQGRTNCKLETTSTVNGGGCRNSSRRQTSRGRGRGRGRIGIRPTKKSVITSTNI